MQSPHEIFAKIVAARAREAQDAGERYSMGTKSVAVPIDMRLMQLYISIHNGNNRLKEQIENIGAVNGNNNNNIESPQDDKKAIALALKLGLVSPTGAQSRLIECRLPHPPSDSEEKVNTGSTIQLAREMEAHLSLVLNALQRALPHMDKKIAAKIKADMYQKLNREILLEQIKWLSTNIKNKNQNLKEYTADMPMSELALVAASYYKIYCSENPGNSRNFNKFLAQKRVELAKQYRDQMVHLLCIHGLIKPDEKQKVIQAVSTLDKTPSTFSDVICQQSATGQYFSTSATENVAHNKELGRDKVAAVRIIVEGTVTWRTPSIAATDAYKKKSTATYNEKEFVDDVTAKLDHLSQQILSTKNGGDPNSPIYYNLLTSYDCTFMADNLQSWSTEIIIHGVHEHNAKKATSTGMVLLTNLSVNQWGATKTEPPQVNCKMRSPTDEIYDLVDLSILQLLKQHLCLPGNESDLSQCADTAIKSYIDFLGNKNRKYNHYYTNNENSDTQRDSIIKFRQEFKSAQYTAAAKTPQQKASMVILIMFATNTYAEKEYGMLMQALLVAAESNKMVGCKSANERFASVMDKSINVSHPVFMKAMDSFIAGTINESQLYTELVKLYNENNVYEGPGQDCSIRDQAATAKAGKFEGTEVQTVPKGNSSENNASSAEQSVSTSDDEEPFVDQNKSVSYDTNLFEPPTVTNLEQGGAKNLQAHNVKSAVSETLGGSIQQQQALETGKKQAVVVTRHYHEQQEAKKTGASSESGEPSSTLPIMKRFKIAVRGRQDPNIASLKENSGMMLYKCAQYIEENTPPKNSLTDDVLLHIKFIHFFVKEIEDQLQQGPYRDKLSRSDLNELIPEMDKLCRQYSTDPMSNEPPKILEKERDAMQSFREVLQKREQGNAPGFN